ncbi:mannitol dehydrogenase family protein [Pelagibacterium halotolerans]|uniref:mannitol dehydrogenase family protein n=1 Tax=Pelagibacterium halotolerans TaxID=531813 RepID=UPI003851827E
MSASIVQFGTSRFLQAHADLILSEARRSGQDVGTVTIVETTGSAASRARIAAFDRGEPFPIRIRGLENGTIRDETRMVDGIVAGLSARTDARALRTAFVEAGYVLSNTGDKGFALPQSPDPTLENWSSFPELLTALLHERWSATGAPVVIMPCELISRNGDTLRSIILELAAMRQDAAAFSDWIKARCVFVNALVDRIVSEPLAPVGAVAEPYALWALEAQPGFVPPCTHDQIQVVSDLGSIERKKLFMLNLGHTLLAQRWRDYGGAPDLTVRESIADPHTIEWLDAILSGEIVPAFPAADDAEAYWRQCKERFANPFLDHRLADIATNHEAKIERRAKGFLDWAETQIPGQSAFPRLRAAFGDFLRTAGERRNAV